MRKIEPWIRSFVSDRDLVVLRQTKDNKALNVSYSEDGLKWTTDTYGNLIYYDNARLRHKQLNKDSWLPYIEGDTTQMSSKVYVEKFRPIDHSKVYLQIAEFLWCNKALRMLYSNNEHV